MIFFCCWQETRGFGPGESRLSAANVAHIFWLSRPGGCSALWEDHAATGATPGRSPVEFEVWREDELARVVHGSPHEAQHQDLQPAALEQVDLVGQTQLNEP